MNNKQLVDLQNKIHAQNVEMGWWDEYRPFSTFACLFHSELSEAMEGDRKGLMDDHLPEYKMFWVELADFVIRCMDYLGSIENPTYEPGWFSCYMGNDACQTIADLHLDVSGAFENDSKGLAFDENLIIAVNRVLINSRQQNIDLIEIINKKVAYNKTRADHQRENREKAGGKKY